MEGFTFEQGQRWRWRRGVSPSVESSGYLTDREADAPLNRAEQYDPLEEPNLPNHLAKVVDAKSAVRFARRFGLLGYSSLALSDVDARVPGDPLFEQLAEVGFGDPLEWVLAQARTVRFAVELIYALGSEDIQAVADVLSRGSSGLVEVPTQDGPSGKEGTEVLPQFIVAVRDRVVPEVWANPHSLPYQAYEIVADLVNWNSAGVASRLFALPDAGLVQLTSADALIEAVWWHVEQWAVGGTVRRCALSTCGTPFLVTDERQRFCPADYVTVEKDGRTRPGRSRCAALYQKRKQSESPTQAHASKKGGRPKSNREKHSNEEGTKGGKP